MKSGICADTGRKRREKKIPELHGSPASVDACAVRPKRELLVRVDSLDKIGSRSLPADCVETALCQLQPRAWNLTVRKYDERNTSDTNSVYALLTRNVRDRNRPKNMEQFDTSKFRRIGDEEKTPADKKRMPERLLNHTFRGTSTCDEVISTLESHDNASRETQENTHQRPTGLWDGS